MALTEQVILDQLKNQLSSAASDCDLIACQPLSGLYYGRMRQSLKLAEGCCRQMAQFREDSRWLNPGIALERAHQKARIWLHRPSIQSKKLFTGLAAALRKMLADLHKLQNLKVGRAGPILPYAVDPKRRGAIAMPFSGALPPTNSPHLFEPAGLRSTGLIA